VFPDKAPKCQFGDRNPARFEKMEHRLPVFPGKFHGLLGTARQNLPNGENHRSVRIPCIPFCALDVVGAGCLLQWVPASNWTIFGQSAFGAPAAVRYCTLDGEIQCGPVSAGLAPRHDFRNLIHQDIVYTKDMWGVEGEVRWRFHF
jgi:hypothetical protein